MITYRKITVEDIPGLSEIFVETFNAPPWSEAWTLETAGRRLGQLFHVQDFYGISAYEGDLLCGMILGSKEQFFDVMVFHIKEFCVSNRLRGQGLGGQLLEEFEKRLKEQGVGRMELLTARGEKTQGFYEKRGLKAYDNMVVMGKTL